MLHVATLLVQSFNLFDERVTKPLRPIAFSLASVFKIPLYENEIKPQLFSPFVYTFLLNSAFTSLILD